MTNKTIWVLTDDPAATRELCGGAQSLGTSVHAILCGDESDAKDALSYGASTVTLLDDPGHTGMIEGYANPVAALLRNEGSGLLLVNASTRGRLLAGKIASYLETSALNASELLVDDDALLIKYMVYGGAAICTRKPLGTFTVVTVGSGVFEPASRDDSRQGSVAHLNAQPIMTGIQVREILPKQSESVNLNAAKRVVGVGRGFAAQADLDLARNLATKVSAELACSRPITESENWMARERYIGVSGVVLKPEVYVAIGISGQVQHMVGVNQAKTIIAINKDKNAPIFKQADVGLVGDLYTIVPALLEAL